MRRSAGTLAAVAFCAALLAGGRARAGTFDALGDFQLDPGDVASNGFETMPMRYVPSGTDMKCMPVAYALVTQPDAIEGQSFLRVNVVSGCAERFLVTLPQTPGSYRASLWVRQGGITASIDVLYTSASGLDSLSVLLSPTGRTTSDGWVELASNDFPVDGASVAEAYLKVVNESYATGVDLDAFEIVSEGSFVAQAGCAGVGDPACDADEVCIYDRCIFAPAQVPVLPADVLKNDVVDVLESQIRNFYGSHRSRALYLPNALALMEQMRTASTGWQFWSLWAAGVHALHDWHTDTDFGITGFVGASHRLNACFIEGNADLSHDAWPSDPMYPDLLVSHVGTADNAGLEAGDRLVAVDGQHPIAWAASLGAVDFNFHVATDPTIFSDYAEELGGAPWSNSLIIHYAHEITVIRCDMNGVCDGAPETIAVTSLGNSGGGSDVACDNRPFYHYDPANNPDPTTHYVFDKFFQGQIAETAPSEAIYGLLFDTLFGGSPSSPVNMSINGAVAFFEQNARGVILDHRAGNGGTLDAATNVTRLARPPGIVGVTRMPMEIAADGDGPADTTAGLAIFDAAMSVSPYNVGDMGWAQNIPVALILHRDGSASDFMPYGMKGAPNTRLFGPHPTSGAFSTYIEFSGWGSLYYQYGSGDTIGADGTALTGHGVVPDVVLLPTQSDLVAGKDTLFEAALAWVRQELKP